MKPERFETLREALDSEDLLSTWDSMRFRGIEYGELREWNHDDGSESGMHVRLYRDLEGYYHRPEYFHW